MSDRFKSKSGNPAGESEPLSALLQLWEGVEPEAGFEAGVWRRIRTGTTPVCRREPRAGPYPGWLMLRPAWVTGYAAAAAVIVGIGMGLLSQQIFPDRPTAHPLLQSRTVAGTYLAVSTGESR